MSIYYANNKDNIPTIQDFYEECDNLGEYIDDNIIISDTLYKVTYLIENYRNNINEELQDIFVQY